MTDRMTPPYRVIVAGSRRWDCPGLAARVLAGLAADHPRLVVAHGDARGVDAAFAGAARDLGLAREPRPDGPEWPAGRYSLCLAFHPDLIIATGTKECLRRALEVGVPSWWTWSEDVPPARLSWESFGWTLARGPPDRPAERRRFARPRRSLRRAGS